jgi:hypothetical protein
MTAQFKIGDRVKYLGESSWSRHIARNGEVGTVVYVYRWGASNYRYDVQFEDRRCMCIQKNLMEEPATTPPKFKVGDIVRYLGGQKSVRDGLTDCEGTVTESGFGSVRVRFNVFGENRDRYVYVKYLSLVTNKENKMRQCEETTETEKSVPPSKDFNTTREIQNYLLGGGKVINLTAYKSLPVFYLADGSLNQPTTFSEPERWGKFVEPLKHSVELYVQTSDTKEYSGSLMGQLGILNWNIRKNETTSKKVRITIEEIPECSSV